MQTYLIALAEGLLVGAIYGMLQVRSPAPPVIALVGLLGEQAVPLVKRWISGQPVMARHASQLPATSTHSSAFPEPT